MARGQILFLSALECRQTPSEHDDYGKMAVRCAGVYAMVATARCMLATYKKDASFFLFFRQRK